MFADSNFAVLCPDLTVKQYCADTSLSEVCCGICPNTGISGLGGHISLAFSSLSSITAIALSPASAPTALTTNLIQANAYALVLLGYLLNNSQELGDAPPTDLFHAAYALLLAFSSLIPLTAIAASPPWAVTGQKSPAERRQEAESIMSVALRELEAGHGDEREHEKLLKRRKRRLRKAMQADPYMLVDALEESDNRGFCGIRGSHWMLYVGTLGSVLLWAFALTQGVLGGAQNSTKVSLAQANCTEGLGSAASSIIVTNVCFMILAVFVAIGIVSNHLVRDLSRSLNMQAQMEYSGSPRLVFGVSFLVWSVWMFVSFSLYFAAGNHNLLSSLEFSWTFGTS
ncbi:hypothetical protein JCM3766R1_001993 [Sporobolomyces carnicolor]